MNVFLLLIAVLNAWQAPSLLIIVIFVMAFRDYYLIKNMKALKLIMKQTENSDL